MEVMKPFQEDFLQNKGVLKEDSPVCEICNLEMSLIKYSYVDGLIYRCARHKGEKMSLRRNTILNGTTIALEKFIMLLYFWVFETETLFLKLLGRWNTRVALCPASPEGCI